MPSEFPHARIDPGHHEVPPRVDGPPRRTSPRTLALGGLSATVVLALAVPQLLFTRVTSPGTTGTVLQGALLVAAALIGLMATVAGWWARTYVVGGDQLVIDEGILSRRRRVVPYGRVQQIDIEQRLVAQLLRLGTLTIETAGSGGGTVRLGMLDIDVARGIRRHVLTERARIQGATRTGPHQPSDQAIDPTATTGIPVLQLDPGRLAVAGVTHHHVVGFVPSVVLVGLLAGALAVPAAPSMRPVAVLAAAVAVAVLVAVGLGLAVLVQYVLGHHGYTVSVQGDDLHLRHGLFQVRNVTIPRRRVQHITVSDNPVRRMLGLVSIHLHSAAPTVDARTSTPWLRSMQSVGGPGADFEIPILARDQVDAVLRALMGADWSIPRLTRRPAVARRRAVTRRVGLLVLAAAVPAAMFPPGSLGLLVVALLGVPWGLIAHRRAGFASDGRTVVLARGVLHHRIDLIPLDRVQSASTASSPFQRLVGLQTLHIDVAGRSGHPSLFDMDRDEALRRARGLPRRSAPVDPGPGGN